MNTRTRVSQVSTNHLKNGELVLIVSSKGRKFLLTLEEDTQFHYQRGVVEHNQMIGGPEGQIVHSSLGDELSVYRPTLQDYTLKLRRKTQIIYPKDVSAILMWADIFPGARVLESGVGSGALTMALLRAVGASGQVISYENRPEMADLARHHIARFLGQIPQHTLKIGNVYESIGESGLDRIVLDLPEPWRALPQVTRALKPGGIVAAHIATTLQVHQYVEALNNSDYALIETFELLLRTWHVKGRSVRPDHRMVAHTGFI
ncbi:MAG: tRNA (adenine-N1)-methyltransferase, partial [Terriglobia bacterium]